MRIPTGPFHAEASSYAGSFTTNGQTVSLSAGLSLTCAEVTFVKSGCRARSSS
jgi:hypothetical protein